jgi:hypothetical protein
MMLGRGAFVFLVAVEAVEYTGYVVDNYCWNQPGHVGIDGSKLGTAPGTHILHCFWQVSACQTGGYSMLQPLASPASDGSTYGIKYKLNSEGSDLVYQLTKAEQSRGGDRKFDEQVTVTGTVSGTLMTVSKVCIAPKVQNPSNATFCYNATASVKRPSLTSSASFRTLVVTCVAVMIATRFE